MIRRRLPTDLSDIQEDTLARLNLSSVAATRRPRGGRSGRTLAALVCATYLEDTHA